MTNEEIKQLWLESGKTLVVEWKDSEGYWNILEDPKFNDPEGYYQFKDGQDFSVINNKVKKAWEDSGWTLKVETTSVDGGWIEFNGAFYNEMIYRIKPGQEQENNQSQQISTASVISEVCKELESLLLDKNRKYGDSALNPIRMFSNASADEQLRIRMDDKLSRIKSAQGDDQEDAKLDLIGYLILERVYKKINGN